MSRVPAILLRGMPKKAACNAAANDALMSLASYTRNIASGNVVLSLSTSLPGQGQPDPLSQPCHSGQNS